MGKIMGLHHVPTIGGWDVRKAHKLGKLVLNRGLQRVLAMLATEVILGQHLAEHGTLPAIVVTMLHQRVVMSAVITCNCKVK